MPQRINLWSGPRNVSTALMYAFAQRRDTRVVDEPLYGHYLHVSGAEHPGRADILGAVDCDGERVVRHVVLGPCDRPVIFLKQMAHHLVGLDWGFLARTQNALLVRDPAEMLPSLAANVREPALADTALAMQVDLLRHLTNAGQHPLVLDAQALLQDPRNALVALCHSLGLEFDERMLSWKQGGRPEDGVWAPHWYANVHRSTGFQPYRKREEPFPDRLRPLLEECRPYYEELCRWAATAGPAAGA